MRNHSDSHIDLKQEPQVPKEEQKTTLIKIPSILDDPEVIEIIEEIVPRVEGDSTSRLKLIADQWRHRLHNN